MSLSTAQISRYKRYLRQYAPDFPIETVAQVQRTRNSAGRVMDGIGAFADGTNRGLPPIVGIFVAAGTANDLGDLGMSALGMARDRGIAYVLGGAAVAPIALVASTIVNGYGSINKSEETLIYLLGTRGYIETIARCCVDSLSSSLTYIRMPSPVIPSFASNTYMLHSENKQIKYRDGCHAASRLYAHIDELRPTSNREDLYSKLFLHHIISLTPQSRRLEELDNPPPINQQDERRLRQANGRLYRSCEEVIREDILSINIDQQAEALRVWGNS